MKLFIWESADETTYNYHSDAGVVIIAEDLESAREIAKASPEVYKKEKSKVFTSEPDQVIEALTPDQVIEALTEARCFVFPNAGCC